MTTFMPFNSTPYVLDHVISTATTSNSFYAATIALAPFLLAIALLFYISNHTDLIPGDPHSIVFLFANATYPQPYASSLSPFSHVYARMVWTMHAFKRGLSPGALAREIKPYHHIDWIGGQRPSAGTLIRAWDRVFEWNNDCIDLLTLERMRDLGDPLSDDVLQFFATTDKDPSMPVDIMERIAEHVLQGKQDAALEFWRAIDRRPPPGCSAISLAWFAQQNLLSDQELQHYQHGSTDHTLVDQRSWLPSDDQVFEARLRPHHIKLMDEEEARVLQRGRDAFTKYGPNMHLGLLLVGLAGGFASPRVINVLKSTAYLVPPRPTKSRSSEDVLDHHERALLQRLHEYVEKGRHHAEIGKGKGPHDAPFSDADLPSFPSEASSTRTFRRLLETMTFVLDVMETSDSLCFPSQSNKHNDTQAMSAKDLLNKGGAGWLACARVRFLHTSVRRRLSRGRGGAEGAGGKESIEGEGVTINQEDLLATLCAFTIAPLWALQRLGLCPSQQERQDMVALFRCVGFYMGIEPRFLRRHFRDVQAAERFFCCAYSHHFLPLARITTPTSPFYPSIPGTLGPEWATRLLKDPAFAANVPTSTLALVSQFDFDSSPTMPLLWTMADRAPANLSFGSLCAVSRFLLGPSLANATRLPTTTGRQYVMMRIKLFVIAYPVLFGQYYPRKAWARKLRMSWATLIRRITVVKSDSQRTSFSTPANEGSGESVYTSVLLDKEQGKRIVRQYRVIVGEMIGVSVLLCLLLCLFAFQGIVQLSI